MLAGLLVGVGCPACKKPAGGSHPTGGTPVAATGQPGGAAAATARIFFQRFGAELVPLTCFDARAKTLLPGGQCLDRMEKDPVVRVLSGSRGQLRAQNIRVKRASIEFIASEQDVPGVRFDLPCAERPEAEQQGACRPPDGAAGLYAAWPSTFPEVTLAASWAPNPESGSLPAGAPPVPEAVALRMRSDLEDYEACRPLPFYLHQRLLFDLDGNGQKDPVYVVRVSTSAPTGEYLCDESAEDYPQFFYRSFLEQPDGSYRRLEIRGEILGWFDLDGDGVAEVWSEEPYYEGQEWTVASGRSEGWKVLASFADGT